MATVSCHHMKFKDSLQLFTEDADPCPTVSAVYNDPISPQVFRMIRLVPTSKEIVVEKAAWSPKLRLLWLQLLPEILMLCLLSPDRKVSCHLYVSAHLQESPDYKLHPVPTLLRLVLHTSPTDRGHWRSLTDGDRQRTSFTTVGLHLWCSPPRASPVPKTKMLNYIEVKRMQACTSLYKSCVCNMPTQITTWDKASFTFLFIEIT